MLLHVEDCVVVFPRPSCAMIPSISIKEQACSTHVSFRFFSVLSVREGMGLWETGSLLRPFWWSTFCSCCIQQPRNATRALRAPTFDCAHQARARQVALRGGKSNLINKPIFPQPPCLSQQQHAAKNLKLTQLEHACSLQKCYISCTISRGI